MKCELFAAEPTLANLADGPSGLTYYRRVGLLGRIKNLSKADLLDLV
jgi:hypothetical protein